MKELVFMFLLTTVCQASEESFPLASQDNLLHSALEKGDLNKVKILLEQGSKPNVLIRIDLIKATPLYHLVSNYYTKINEQNKKSEALHLLCQHGAHLDYGGLSWLKYADVRRHPLKESNSPEILSPLSFCIRYYSYTAAAILVSYGADQEKATQNFNSQRLFNKRAEDFFKTLPFQEDLAIQLKLPLEYIPFQK